MAKAQSKSIIQELFIESNDQKRTVDITTGAISIDYYEDIFSPTITAKIKVINTNNSIAPPDREGNSDGAKMSIYNGLPLRGGERVALKIAKNTQSNKDLDFSKRPQDYFYVSSITDVISENLKESFTLNLVSREALTNETARVSRKYPTSSTINASVESILKDVLKTNKIGAIDKTKNKYGFIGNLRKPFTVLVWLASKSVPETSQGNSTAGYVFYQTQDGFQFRSIDGLISQEPKAEYTYSEVLESYDENQNQVNNDFKILNYNTEKNQNLIEKLRLGTYSSFRMFFNPLTFTFTNDQATAFRISEYNGKAKNLGKKNVELPKVSEGINSDLGNTPTRIITQILDLGTMDPEVSTEENSDPLMYQSQALTRYNLLLTQSLNMIVPLNTNLKAGDIISCKFPRISQSDQSEFDSEQSGLYMIKELCHHFDTEASYTSMKLVRDTYGQK
jgi:hypothetical protein